MPSKKRKQQTHNRTILVIVVLTIIVAISYSFYWLSSQNRTIPTPSTSSFTPTDWMSFIPANISAFRYLNLTFLNNYSNLFGTPEILNSSSSPVNITVTDLDYLLVVQSSTNTTINILGINASTYGTDLNAFNNANLTTDSYNSVTLYRLVNTTTLGPVWACFLRGNLVLAQGNADAEQVLHSVIDSNSTTFFSSDPLKVGYLLTVSTGPCFAFSYYQAGNSNFTVDWEMHGATNSSTVIIRDSYHFPTVADLNNDLSKVKSELFYPEAIVYTSGSFIVGDTSYSSSDIRAVLMSI